MLCTLPLLLPCPYSPCLWCRFNYSLKLLSVIRGSCQTSHKKPNNWHSAEHNKDRHQYYNTVKGHRSLCLPFCRHWQKYMCPISSLCIYFFFNILLPICRLTCGCIILTALPSSISCSYYYVSHIASLHLFMQLHFWSERNFKVLFHINLTLVCGHTGNEESSLALNSSKSSEVFCGKRWTCIAPTHSSHTRASKARWWSRSRAFNYQGIETGCLLSFSQNADSVQEAPAQPVSREM